MSPESEDLYGDASAPAATSDQPASKDGDDDGGSTSILPRAFFPNKDLKVGDVCSVEIKAIHENDVEVVYSDNQEGDDMDKGDDSDASPPPAASGDDGGDDGGMSSMMQ